MPSLRVALVAVMTLCLLTVSPAFAQPTPEQIDNAITTVKTGGGEGAQAGNAFQSARNLLINNPGQSLDAVVDLLNEMDAQARISAAAILSDIAAKHGMSDAVVEALVRCADESNRGVVYLGCIALMSPAAPPRAAEAALERSLGAEYGLDNSPALRLAVAHLAAERDLVIALPYLLGHMQRLLKPYDQQLASRLTYEIEDPNAPAVVAPAAPAVGGGAGGGRLVRQPAAGRAETEFRRPIIRVRIDPDELTLPDIEALIPAVVRLPAVVEMQQMGLAVEELAKTVEPQAKFGFDSMAPWNYQQALENASAWYEANKGKINASAPVVAPAPAPEEAPAPEAEPAPEEAPAPEAEPAAEG